MSQEEIVTTYAYDPRPLNEVEAEQAARWQKLHDEGGWAIWTDSDGTPRRVRRIGPATQVSEGEWVAPVTPLSEEQLERLYSPIGNEDAYPELPGVVRELIDEEVGDELRRRLAAVRSLCDEWDVFSKGESPTTRRIRAAIAGEQP